MEEEYFIIKKRAVPDVLLKVVEANRLIDSNRMLTIQDATERIGISRSSYYKYKDDIMPFHENTRGRTLTFMLQLDDKPGILSVVLSALASANTNVLTIHQAIPTGGLALVTLSIEVTQETDNIEKLMQKLEKVKGVNSLKILGYEE